MLQQIALDDNGFHNKVCGMTYEKCATLGIDEVQVSANEENLRSNKVIMRNGGTLLNKRDGKLFYIIKCKQLTP